MDGPAPPQRRTASPPPTGDVSPTPALHQPPRGAAPEGSCRWVCEHPSRLPAAAGGSPSLLLELTCVRASLPSPVLRAPNSCRNSMALLFPAAPCLPTTAPSCVGALCTEPPSHHDLHRPLFFICQDQPCRLLQEAVLGLLRMPAGWPGSVLGAGVLTVPLSCAPVHVRGLLRAGAQAPPLHPSPAQGRTFRVTDGWRREEHSRKHL